MVFPVAVEQLTLYFKQKESINNSPQQLLIIAEAAELPSVKSKA